ncbi:MAG TPA: DUF547 domain-containing protein [Robiginitalea sp.]|nr:DUF547 domain-containing protein [Robiginitalea sp.]
MPARFCAPLLIAIFACAPLIGLQAQADAPEPGHTAWDRLLQRHVRADGTVDYPGFAGEREQLDAYIADLGTRVPDSAWARDRRLAYFINLYNALTVRLVLEHYPLRSIRDLPDPWGRELVSIGGKGYSLDVIEHQVLRKMGEPRIHFALNCASVSCPVLQPHAFTEQGLDAQLEEAARSFINDPARNRIQPGSAALSRLFKWYRSDFEGASGSLPAFLNAYLDTPLEPGSRIRFLPYDWNLNQAPRP